MIVVIQTAFIGDCVLSLPFLHELLRTHPKDKVKIVTHKLGEELFRIALERTLAPFRERVSFALFDKKKQHRGFFAMLDFAEKLSSEAPVKKVFCLQRSFRSGLLAFLMGSPERIGFSSGAASFFYTVALRRDWNSGRSELEKNLDLLRGIGCEVPPWNPRVAPSLLAPPLVSKIQKGLPGFVGLSLGSPWATKRWPVENAAKLCKLWVDEGWAVTLLGDAAAIPLGAEVKKLVPSLLITDRCGQTTLREWIDEIYRLNLLVSNDSAAVHVASDLNIPTLALFGPTLPDFGFAPWRPGSLVLGVEKLPCRPCDIHGPKICPLGHHKCLQEITGELVHKQFLRLVVKSA